jgi:hypothetical protein
VSVFTYKKPAVQRDILLGQRFNFFYKCVGVNYHGVCDYADNIRPDRPAGQKVQSESVIAYDDGVTGVGAAAVPHNNITVLGENINYLASIHSCVHFEKYVPKDRPQQPINSACCGQPIKL